MNKRLHQLQVVVDQTNLYAQQYLDANELGHRSRVHDWKKAPHNLAELKKFLALIIVMGIVQLPNIEQAWSTKWPDASSSFSSIMKRDRFSLILRFLHLSDSSKYIPKGQPGYDPLYKIRPFVDPLLKNFQSAYNLGREVSIHESMIGFKGRLHFIQYMPDKPTKWGMKAFVLADSKNGYSYNWRLYTGKYMFHKHTLVYKKRHTCTCNCLSYRKGRYTRHDKWAYLCCSDEAVGVIGEKGSPCLL